MNELKIEDTFYITGKGYVFYLYLPTEWRIEISINDIISFDEDENYTVTGVERSINGFGKPSVGIGILVRGELKDDKKTYRDRKFIILKGE